MHGRSVDLERVDTDKLRGSGSMHRRHPLEYWHRGSSNHAFVHSLLCIILPRSSNRRVLKHKPQKKKNQTCSVVIGWEITSNFFKSLFLQNYLETGGRQQCKSLGIQFVKKSKGRQKISNKRREKKKGGIFDMMPLSQTALVWHQRSWGKRREPPPASAALIIHLVRLWSIILYLLTRNIEI